MAYRLMTSEMRSEEICDRNDLLQDLTEDEFVYTDEVETQKWGNQEFVLLFPYEVKKKDVVCIKVADDF